MHSLPPLLPGACEKFFRVLEVDDVGVVVVANVVDDPSLQLDNEVKVVLMEIPDRTKELTRGGE
jgi:hypothetical protein